MFVIGLGHRARVGKNLAGQRLLTYFGHRNFRADQVSFVSDLKAVCHFLYGWDGMGSEMELESSPEMKNRVLPSTGKTQRQLLIDVGYKMREVDPLVWVRKALLPAPVDFRVITDLRYPNEAEEIKRHGGVVVRIDRPSIPKSNDFADIALADYAEWDYEIRNDGDREEFLYKIDQLAEQLIALHQWRREAA